MHVSTQFNSLDQSASNSSALLSLVLVLDSGKIRKNNTESEKDEPPSRSFFIPIFTYFSAS